MSLDLDSSQLEHHLAQSLRGDPQAFEPVVLMFERQIRGWIARRCPPGGDVDDVAQRTFIEAYKRLAEYRAGTDFHHWLFAIAKYQVMTECTRLRRLDDYRSRYAQQALADELQRRVESPGDVASPRIEWLQCCLDLLGKSSRELIRWRYQDELPLKEIAERTQRSVGAIKKSLHSVRNQLRDCVERKAASK